MKLKGLTIKNYRCFGEEGIKLDNFGDINILVGPNNSGKSTVLEVLSKAFQSTGETQSIWNPGSAFEIAEDESPDGSRTAETQIGLTIPFNELFTEDGKLGESIAHLKNVVWQVPRAGFKPLNCLSEAKALFQDISINAISSRELKELLHPAFKVGVAVKAAEIYETSPEHYADLVSEVFGEDVRPGDAVLRGDMNTIKKRRAKELTARECLNQLIGQIASATFKTILKHKHETALVHYPTKRAVSAGDVGTQQKVREFNDNGVGLTNTIASIIDVKDHDGLQILRKIEADLPEFFPELQDVSIRHALVDIFEAEQNTTKKARKIHLEQSRMLPLDMYGGAVQDVFLFLCDLHFHAKSNGSSMVLVEEPENHIHPPMQRRLYDYLEKFAQNHGNCQMFISTHSGSFLRKSNLSNVYRLDRPKVTAEPKVTYVEISDSSKDSKSVTRYMVPMYLHTVALSECVVLVEGPSDKVIFEWLFKDVKASVEEELLKINVRGDFRVPVVDVISMEGGGSVDKALLLWRRLNPNTFGIIDLNRIGEIPGEFRKAVGVPYTKKLSSDSPKSHRIKLRRGGLIVLSRDGIERYYNEPYRNEEKLSSNQKMKLALKAVDDECEDVFIEERDELERHAKDILLSVAKGDEWKKWPHDSE